jgi:multicomponent Na+:H+ antiporter subunit D
MSQLIILPILTPLFFTVLLFLAWHRPIWQRALTITCTVIELIVALALFIKVNHAHYLVMQLSNWKAPFGISLVADSLSALLVLTTSFIMLCIAIYSIGDVSNRSIKKGFYPAFCILLAGLCGAFLTGDIFNLYVWFEIILISSFVLMVLSDGKRQLEGAVKYAVLNLIATMLLLAAIALIYGVAGTLNLADLAQIIHTSHRAGLITTIAVIFLVALGIKSALFPLFFWLPAAYHTAYNTSSAIFAGLLSKVGVYTFLRLFTLLFFQHAGYLHSLLLIIANLTLIIGILGAIARVELRRILSFTLISHIGYMILGLALLTPLALLGSIF